MKILGRFFFLMIVYVSCFNPIHGFSQKKGIDSLYNDFINTRDVALKFKKGLSVIQTVSLYDHTEKIEQIITNLEQTAVTPTFSNIKQGLIFYAKANNCDIKNDMLGSIANSKQSIFYFKDNKDYLTYPQSFLVRSLFFDGQFDSCIALGNKVLKNIRENKKVTEELDVLLCISRSYDFIGDRKQAIHLSFQAIELAKQHHNVIKLSELYTGLSNIYKSESINESKKYALLSLSVLKEAHLMSSNKVLSASYLMLGNVYYDLKKMDSSMYYYELCKTSTKETNNQRTYLSAIGNMGNIAYNEHEYQKAIDYNLETLIGYKKLNIITEIAVAYGSLADIYKDTKQYDLAIKYYDSALVITNRIKSVDDYIYNYQGLSETYEKMGNYKDAFKYYKLYKAFNDSLNNNSNSKKIIELELDYKYKTAQQEKDLIQKNKDALSQEKIKQQQYIIVAAVLGGLLLLGFLIFTIKSNIERKKINKKLQTFNSEISAQKNIIETKNNEITDSITYASRIQQGIIPDSEELTKLLPNHFVFFKPRDIVSGDFYWASKIYSPKDEYKNQVAIALADCTGHGVPGAFMSMVGYTLLNQTLSERSINNPAQALDYINKQLPKTIKSKTSTGTIKDGMEVAMCLFNFDTLTLQFAGANSNIYLVRNNNIHIYKGDKQPIGEGFSDNIKAFTNQIIALQKNDCIFLISDGYADQFGGEKGKKFKYKQLENLFCTIATKPIDEQRLILENTFNSWKANHEQVDDVLIIGIKI